MDHLEQQFLSTQPLQPMVWWRYIDDIFLIWPHSEEELHTFCTNLNQHHHTIKFTSDYSRTEAVFLDTRVYLKDGLIQTDLYTKPTNTHISIWTPEAATHAIAKQLFSTVRPSVYAEFALKTQISRRDWKN